MMPWQYSAWFQQAFKETYQKKKKTALTELSFLWKKDWKTQQY